VIGNNTAFFYSQGDIGVKVDRQSFKIASAYGTRDERHKSMKTVISFTPVGELRSTAYVAKHFPYGPGDIGKSIFTVAGGALDIWSIPEGKKYSWTRGAISKYPKLTLAPTKSAYGDIEFTAIGKAATLPTAADFMRTISSSAFADTSYDDTKVFTDIYNAALGVRSSPYAAMGGMEGFEVEPMLTVKEIPASDIGIADILVDDIWLAVRFAPSSLTEAEIDTLMNIQGTGAILPGLSYAKALEDLVISSSSFTVTAAKVGVKSYEGVYGVAHRHKVLEFTPVRAGSVLAATPLWTMTVN
jgi:hypothetical protein